MRQTIAEVMAVECLGPFARVSFAAPDLAASLEPGRAVLAGPIHAYLRQTWWPCAIDRQGFSVLLSQVSPSEFRVGYRIDVVGAIGRGFQVEQASRNLLLVAAGTSAPQPDLGPLLALIDEALGSGRSVTLAYTAPSADEAYPVSALPPAIEVMHGGDAGLLDRLAEAITWADQIFACGPPDFTARLAQRIEGNRFPVPRTFAQALNPVELVCGVGACGACWNGPTLACVHGPVFELNTHSSHTRTRSSR